MMNPRVLKLINVLKSIKYKESGGYVVFYLGNLIRASTAAVESYSGWNGPKRPQPVFPL